MLKYTYKTNWPIFWNTDRQRITLKILLISKIETFVWKGFPKEWQRETERDREKKRERKREGEEREGGVKIYIFNKLTNNLKYRQRNPEYGHIVYKSAQDVQIKAYLLYEGCFFLHIVYKYIFHEFHSKPDR